VRVRHEFEGFWPIAKKYFLRAYYWTKLYERRKKFDPVATTWQEAATTLSGVGLVGLTILALFTPYWLVGWIGGIRVALVGLLFLHLILVRTFLLFVYKEKGLMFAIQSFVMGLVLYCFIFAGALWGRVRST